MKTSWIVATASAALAGLLIAGSSKKALQIIVTTTVTTPRNTTFGYVFPAGLPHFFKGTTFIPAVVSTSLDEGWHTPGLVRTIFFQDGSTSQESLLTVIAPASFSYKNDLFTALAPQLLLKRLESE